jgi:hypothetical protein
MPVLSVLGASGLTEVAVTRRTTRSSLGVAVPAQPQVVTITKALGLDEIGAAGDPAFHKTAITPLPGRRRGFTLSDQGPARERALQGRVHHCSACAETGGQCLQVPHGLWSATSHPAVE